MLRANLEVVAAYLRQQATNPKSVGSLVHAGRVHRLPMATGLRCLFASKKQNSQSYLRKYESIKQAEAKRQSSPTAPTVSQPNPSPKPSQQEPQQAKIRCQGCNVTLQCKDKTKYGYIAQKVLKEALQTNISQLSSLYGQKAHNKDAKMMEIINEVEKESGIKIFNQESKNLQNLDNIEVLMRLEEKIDKYEQQQQLAHRRKNTRNELICFRCFSLKHHNRLPQQYDTNLGFTTDTTEFIMSKMLNRHKGYNVEYFFMVDAYDILGTFQEWLFKRLLKNDLNISIIVNKIDVINKEYIHEMALHAAVRKRLNTFLKDHISNQDELEQKMRSIQIYYVSCTSRDGIKKLKQHIEKNASDIQLVGYPNTGKTTLLNILARLRKSTSKLPGTTVKITEHGLGTSKRKIYDMPGLYSENLLYNLVQKPSLKMLLTWDKKIAPGLLTHETFIYGGKLEIRDVRIVVFGLGGACSSSNRWFVDHYKQFWVGLPDPSKLNIKKYEIDIHFKKGKADDLEIAGYGFIGFRLCIPNIEETTRKLTLYLPEKVQFAFRPTILSVNDSIFHNKSALTKKFMLERLTIKQKPALKKRRPTRELKQQAESKIQDSSQSESSESSEDDSSESSSSQQLEEKMPEKDQSNQSSQNQ